MATSVSKINVQVGANTQQLTSGMQQASVAVQGFSTNAKTLQGVAQQATFAVDDFAASFATGGLAGGIRGAANNITLIASMLGGVKVQLLAIAGLAVAGVLANHFRRTKEETEGASAALDEFVTKLKRLSDVPQQQRMLRERLFDIRSETSLTSLQRLQGSGAERLAGLEEQLTAERRHIGNLKALRASLVDENAVKKVEEEIAARTKELQTTRDQVKEQKALNEALAEQIRIVKENVAPGVPSDRFGFFLDQFGRAGGSAAAQRISAQLRAGRQSAAFNPTQFFGRLPPANAFGSAGAVSAINQAQIGPRNVQDAQLRELQGINRSVGDLSRNLGSKLPIAVEVPL